MEALWLHHSTLHLIFDARCGVWREGPEHATAFFGPSRQFLADLWSCFMFPSQALIVNIAGEDFCYTYHEMRERPYNVVNVVHEWWCKAEVCLKSNLSLWLYCMKHLEIIWVSLAIGAVDIAFKCLTAGCRGFLFAMPWKTKDLHLNEIDWAMPRLAAGHRLTVEEIWVESDFTKPPDYLTLCNKGRTSQRFQWLR